MGNEHWLERWTPAVAGLAIQDTTGTRSLVITPRAGLGVLAIWAAAGMLAGGLAFRFRDVQPGGTGGGRNPARGIAAGSGGRSGRDAAGRGGR